MNDPKQTPKIYRQIALSGEDFSALTCALDYLLHCDDYSYVGKNFTWMTAADAADNVDNHESTYSKSELAVFIAAIDCSLSGLQSRDSSFESVADVFPDLIPDLEKAAPCLNDLRPRLCAYLDDLN